MSSYQASWLANLPASPGPSCYGSDFPKNMPEQSQYSGNFPKDWAVPTISHRRSTAHGQCWHTLRSEVPIHSRPPPRLVALSLTLVHPISVHRCMAGKPKTRWASQTLSVGIPQDHQPHNHLRKVEPLTARGTAVALHTPTEHVLLLRQDALRN